MAFRRLERGKPDPGQAQFRLDALNALGEQQALEAIDLDAGGIENTALDIGFGQGAGQPEPVVPSLTADQDPALFANGNAQLGHHFAQGCRR
jgi:hypothetical protein